MKKNYIQFLLLALVATGMVMISGIRNDLNYLETQIASTGKVGVNKNIDDIGTTQKITNTSKTFSMAEIENTITRFGWVKQIDNSYISHGGTIVDLHYACPNCPGTGSGCCVVNGVGSSNSSGTEGCWGSYGTTNYQGICTVPRLNTGGGDVTSTQKTSSASAGSSGTAEKPKACTRSETCPQGQACKNNICVPCWGQGCIDGATRVSNTGTSNSILTTTLRPGSVSSDVTILQKMLVSLGFLSVTPSGNFLSKTEAGVKAFQTAYGISPVSGIVGELTRAKLNSICAISSDGSVVSCNQ